MLPKGGEKGRGVAGQRRQGEEGFRRRRPRAPMLPDVAGSFRLGQEGNPSLLVATSPSPAAQKSGDVARDLASREHSAFSQCGTECRVVLLLCNVSPLSVVTGLGLEASEQW